jgi:hypothetical protein
MIEPVWLHGLKIGFDANISKSVPSFKDLSFRQKTFAAKTFAAKTY